MQHSAKMLYCDREWVYGRGQTGEEQRGWGREITVDPCGGVAGLNQQNI